MHSTTTGHIGVRPDHSLRDARAQDRQRMGGPLLGEVVSFTEVL